MGPYIVKRLLQSVVVIVGVSVLTFGVMFMTGDPTALMVPSNWTKDQIQQFRHDMGFDRPWPVQYVEYVEKAVRGDLGVSLRHRSSVTELILQRFPATLQLSLVALFFALIVAIPMGVVAAYRRNSWFDGGSMAFALLGQSMPVYWLGLLLMLVFGVALKWLPISGRGTPAHLVLPALSLALFSMDRTARLVRSSMLEILSLDFIRTARAKGLNERIVLYKHGLKNAMIPVVTLIGLELGVLLGGATVTETVFSWPGLGRLVIDAIYNKDYPLVQGAVLFMALIFVVANLAVDISYAYLDPRIRYR